MPGVPGRGERFARRVFAFAGLAGLAAILPLYALEGRLSSYMAPPISHPEYYYGFAGVATAWQLAFLIIARDPSRHRPLMPAAMVEKFSFAAAVLALWARGRVPGLVVPAGLFDLALGLLFVAAYVACRPVPHAD